jgi:hypothetical protein
MLSLASDLHKKNDSSVGHGKSQSQDPAAHDGITQVEGGHAERRFAFKLSNIHKRIDQQVKVIIAYKLDKPPKK